MAQCKQGFHFLDQLRINVCKQKLAAGSVELDRCLVELFHSLPMIR